MKNPIKVFGPEILPGTLEISNRNHPGMWIWVTLPAGLQWGNLQSVNTIRGNFQLHQVQALVY